MSTQIKDRGVIFSGDMILAILDSRKSQTRRVINPQPSGLNLDDLLDGKWLRKKFDGLLLPKIADLSMHCPYGKIGDRLYVRETWGQISVDGPSHGPITIHRADWGDLDDAILAEDYGIEKVKWKSPRYMPKRLARIWLEITAIRVERVCDISEDDARVEGVEPDFETASFADGFMHLWDSLNYKRGFGWDANVWVWAITFRRIKNEGATSRKSFAHGRSLN